MKKKILLVVMAAVLALDVLNLTKYHRMYPRKLTILM